jgi:hypothetical protein
MLVESESAACRRSLTVEMFSSFFSEVLLQD